MTTKDWFTLAISIAALVTSVLSFYRSMRVADRQYALAFCQDVARWAVAALDLFRDIETNSIRGLNPETNANWYSDLLPRVQSALDQGALLFPSTVVYGNRVEASHPVLAVMATFVNRVADDRIRLSKLPSGTRFTRTAYSDLRAEFVVAIQSEIRVEMRYLEAVKTIAGRPEAGEVIARALRASAKP